MLSNFFSLGTPIKNNKKIVLFRHAQSFGNVKQILYGVTDYELTDFGKEQASWLKDPFQKNLGKIDKIYSSSLKRAMQTAQVALSIQSEAEFRNKVEIAQGIQEWNFGSLENLDCSNNSVFDHINFIELFLNGKILRDDIEHVSNVEKRLFEAMSKFPSDKNVVAFSHYVMQQIIQKKLGICGLHLNNCGALAFYADQNGKPAE